jgi:hypothetical protein
MMRAAVQSRVPTRKEEVKLCRDRRPITTAVSSNAHVLQGWVAVIPSLPLTFLFSNILNISQHGAALVLARPKKQSLHWRVFQFWHLGVLHAGRCAQAATIPPVKIILAAARAAPRRASPHALLPGCSCICILRNNSILLAAAV